MFTSWGKESWYCYVMSKRKPEVVEVRLDRIVGGGQAIGTLPSGRKLFVWGGLPGERVSARLTKKKASYAEGIVTEIFEPSPDRIAPKDPDSYLSTSPWQIMTFQAEQRYKAQLIQEAFELHGITLPEPVDVYTDGQEYRYRNKVEFSWYGHTDAISGADTLHLAFFRRGSRGKILIDDSALLPLEMMKLARAIRDTLQTAGATARQLKTLLIRSDAADNCVWQLYIKDIHCDFTDALMEASLPAIGGEVIYSNPKSPASVITERLASTGETTLQDTVLGVPFRYATEGFFQINLSVYEQALRDMKAWIDNTATDTSRAPVIDLYSGVGSIGLTIGGPGVTLVEINEHAVREMKRNIKQLGIDATPVLAASEQALNYITSNKIVIVDPPRAGLHSEVVEAILEAKPPRILYLSCNPATQARDVALLREHYSIRTHKGYNFFPRTPHIEHLVVLDIR